MKIRISDNHLVGLQQQKQQHCVDDDNSGYLLCQAITAIISAITLLNPKISLCQTRKIPSHTKKCPDFGCFILAVYYLTPPRYEGPSSSVIVRSLLVVAEFFVQSLISVKFSVLRPEVF